MLARLQEQVAAAATADPLGGMPLPARCHALLQALLGALGAGRRLDAVRLPLYGALSSYLGMCLGPALLRAPPAVVEALLAGLSGGGGGGGSGAGGRSTGAAQQLDALQQQLEGGNSALLQASPQLIELLALDAVSSHPTVAARGLSTLCTLLAADPGGVAADEVYRTALPGRVLQELQEGAHAALTQVGGPGS